MELCTCCGEPLPTTGEIPEYEGELYATWECIEVIQDMEADLENSY